ncbi:family 16 glycosylhydrolase [Tenacibaculum sp. 190524A02b]|uniref:family 16 glycosylhydrolase n=1 Tax=Tenacibaculum vairaonense TaxID=3137860 RepID=UPI0031FA6E08
MKKNINKSIYLVAFLGILLFTQCKENEYEFGSIVVPSNIQVSAEIIGQDATNPYGDGSGEVNFTFSATNALSYVVNFSDGTEKAAPSGKASHTFSKTGVHKYIVTIIAVGTGGVKTSSTIEVEVFSAFSDVEAENFLAGLAVGDSKKWYWQADVAVHVGLGPVTDDYGNGEFAYPAWWSAIQPWDTEKSCMYDNEFVFTRTATGITFEQTVGPAFVPKAYADVIGVAGDTCHDDSVASSMFGVKEVSFGKSTSKAGVEGTWNGQPYRGTFFQIADDGFMGWYVGASRYDIITITPDKMIVRIIQKGDGFAWYHTFVSTKPTQGSNYIYNNLVWEDDFIINGAPDTSKWTYDIGTGTNGWGNNESQYYTNRADNVVVENGHLIITAKKEDYMGSAYTSARLKTEGLFDFKYGRVEIKAKLPGSAGTWPALWMLGSNFSTIGWPRCGEIDIMEQTGNDKNTVLATCHWFDTASNTKADFGQTTSITNATIAFHKYTLEWTPESIKMYVDDVKYYELANNANLPFDQNFFLLFNIAMGGTLGGSIDAAFLQETMEIDYVKVYQ